MDGMKVVSVILILLGLFYVLVPHDIHVATIGLGLEHTMHQVLGVILLVIGIVLWWKGKKAKK